MYIRRDEVLKTMKEMQKVDEEHVKRTNAVHKQMLAAAARRDTPSADCVAQESDGRVAADKLLDLRFAMRKATTREEWQAVFDKAK